ncbi:hypothetical protein [Erysipelothrix anatis]|uniref:hypothetical protein n=1 Tax=Erysipelothrix anatis TaxID=2683713 RepID=UPI001409D359|nr:hypothetical protein [Erysipelothrix anatis]
MNKGQMDFKSMFSVEMIVVFGIVTVLFNTFIVPNINELLGIPVVIGFVVLLIILSLPSGTNRTYTTLSSMNFWMKYQVHSEKRKLKHDHEDGLVRGFKNMFNRGHTTIKKNNRNDSKKVHQWSLEDAGILDITEDTYIDKNNEEFAVYQYEFESMIGINSDVDDENHDHQVQLFDSLSMPGKLSWPFYNNQSLNDVHSFFIDELDHSRYVEEIEESLLWLSYFSEETYPVKVIDVHVGDIENFLRNGSHLKLKRYTGDELIEHLHDRQSGGLTH